MVSVEELHGMKYADLRKLAKSFGVKANMKADKLIACIERELKKQSTAETGHDSTIEKENTSAVMDSSSTGDSTEDEEITFKSSSPAKSLGKRKGKKVVGKPKRAKMSSPELRKPAVGKSPSVESSLRKSLPSSRPATPASLTTGSAKVTPKVASKGSIGKGTPTLSATRKTTPKVGSVKRGTPLSSGKKETPRGSATKKVTPSRSAGRKVSPKGSATKKVTPSRSAGKKATPKSSSTKKATGVAKKVTPVRSATKKTTPKSNSRRKTTPKGSAGKLKKSPANSGKKSTPQSTSKIPRKSASPDVKKMLEAMNGSKSSEEMKANLMATLNKSTSEQLEQKPSDPDKSSQIPRFVAFAMRKKAEATVGPDFAKIHQRKFDKMEGLDSYLVKKRTRTESLTTSVKKARLIAEKTRAAIDSLNQCKTPPVLNGEKDKAVKSRAALFKSPHVGVPFLPKVTSTTKMNTNFTATAAGTAKTPASSNTNKVVAKTPAAAPASVSKENASRKSAGALHKSFNTARKSHGAPRKSGAGDSLNRSMVTPLKFNTSANTSSMNMSINSAKKFDIRASLAKPLTWRPHAGKLKAFSFSTSVGVTGAPRVDPKEFKAKSKDQYRKEAQRHRAASRHDAQMKRRGVKA